jgi:hypothetical protein
MSAWHEEVQSHFDQFLVRVGPDHPKWCREENAQYCLGMVASAMIAQLITVEHGRELNKLVHETRAKA